MADGIKNPVNLAFIVSSLMGDIFDLTQKTYDTIATAAYALDNDAGFDFTLGKFTYAGEKMRTFMDKLNFSAMIIDYGLAETFAGILGATNTIESAAISLGANGTVSISGQKIDQAAPANVQIETPDLAVMEAVYNTQLGVIAVEGVADLVNAGFGIAGFVNTGSPTKIIQEAL
jgi:hypothetical protein